MTGGQIKNPGARAAQPGLNMAGNGSFIADDAQAVTLRLKGRWHGHYGVAGCPVCQAGWTGSALTISRSASGRLLVHCKKSACSFKDILAAAGLSREVFTPDPMGAIRYEARAKAEAVLRSARARRIWDESEPIRSTPGETYMANRGLMLWQHDDCHPRTLRCHPRLLHVPSGKFFPAMIGLVEGGGGFAIHRTYLTPDGAKASIEPAKMMMGATAGGAVRLLEGDCETLIVGEGIESTISIALAADDERLASASTWAALSASGMRGLRLPETPASLVIGADGDDAGRAAAHGLAERACRLGWQVAILAPPEGLDFNDLLRSGTAVPSC